MYLCQILHLKGSKRYIDSERIVSKIGIHFSNFINICFFIK